MPDTLPRHHAATGDLIFREGDAAACAFVIETGAVTISAARGTGEIALATLHQGDLFGEMALIDDKPRSATARAAEPTTLIVIGREQVSRKMESADPLIKLFLRVILRRLRRTSGLVGDSAPVAADFLLEDKVEDSAVYRLRSQAIEMLERERSVEQALERNEFELYFQPMVSLATGVPAGYEAVLRWRQPDGSVRQPTSFIELAESAGLMARLTEVVLRGVCQALGPLREAIRTMHPAMAAPFVSFNLSAQELSDSNLVDSILAVVRGASVDPGHLQVEVTESVLMQDPEHAAVVLQRLKAEGMTVSVDDFGTGYSSLSYLQYLPLDVLKIDRSFITGLPTRIGSRKIVRAVARLAHELGLLTVAEGVESPEELTLIREYGCDLVQGFLFAPPMSLAQTVADACSPFGLPPVHA